MPGRGRSAWLADPNDYVLRHVSHGADRADRAKRRRDRRLGRDVDGRPPRHHAGGAATNAGREARRQRRRPVHRACRARTDPRLLRPRPDVRDLRRDRAVHPYGVGAVRTAHRRAMGAPYGLQRPPARRRPLGTRPTTRASRFRSAQRRRRPTCGRCGMRSAARRSFLRGEESDLLSAATAAADGRPRSASPTLIEFAGVGHAPMLLSTEQIDPVVRFFGRMKTSAARGPPAVPAGRDIASFGCRARGHNPALSLTIDEVTVPESPCRSPSACRRRSAAGQSAGNPAGQGVSVARRAADQGPGRGGPRHRRLAGGDQPGRNERLEAPRARRALLGDGRPRCGRSSRSSSRRLRIRFPGEALGGREGRARARARAVRRVQAPAAPRIGKAHPADRQPAAGRAGAPLPAMRGARADQQLSVVFAGARRRRGSTRMRSTRSRASARCTRARSRTISPR